MAVIMYSIYILVSILIIRQPSSVQAVPYENKPFAQPDWNADAQETLKERLKVKENTNVAKNVILFIGDGMGISTVTASRIYKGQKMGRPGEETVLNFETLPNVALSKVYTVNFQVPDSAATATAMLTGVKTNNRMIGVNGQVVYKDCSTVPGNELESIGVWSKREGKSIGVISTTRITHATPASMYAHTPSRFWETDDDLPSGVGCLDIAAQFISNNRDINVAMSGGRAHLTPKTKRDPEYPHHHGDREDGRDLIQEWIDHKKNMPSRYSYVWNFTQFNNVDPENTEFLLGLFEESYMQYELDRHSDPGGEPSLADMVDKAIRILDNNEKGYFLLVEGGKIDMAHHKNNAKRALEDTIAYDNAVRRALELTSEEDTLIVVTADHSHTFTIGGYPSRGHNILGKLDEDDYIFGAPKDDLPSTSLNYANGPGPLNRSLLKNQDTNDDDFKQPVLIPLSRDTHSAEDVAIYARGPMSHLFNGVVEQNYIAHAMAYASCVGVNKDHCKAKPTDGMADEIITTTTPSAQIFKVICSSAESNSAVFVNCVLCFIFASFKHI